jgi:hypothetical protein
MGALVTLELPDDSPALELPWIITFGPLDDDDGWEPVVCGPYERPHALALAESVVADEDLMAVVEPLLPHVSVDEIRSEIAAARLAVEEDEPDDDLDGHGAEPEAHEHERVNVPSAPPDPEEIRAGLDRIAARLSTYAP